MLPRPRRLEPGSDRRPSDVRPFARRVCLDARTLRSPQRGHGRRHLPIPRPRSEVLLPRRPRRPRRSQGEREYWYGDFYPLTPPVLGPGALIAWQLHRSDLNSGIVLAFRHSECPYPVLQAGLHGLNPKASYVLDFCEEGRTNQQRTITGRQLMTNLELRMSKRATSLLVRYKQEIGRAS